MTPVALAGFCSAMTAIAVSQLVLDEETDGVDVGTTVLVAGVTVLALLWSLLEVAWASRLVSLVVGTVGLVLVTVGVVLIGRHWSPTDDRDDQDTSRGEHT